MSSSDDKLKRINIEALFRNDNYIVPIYQRNYAWRKKEIEQLLDDINDYVCNESLKEKNYYIGSLVIYRRSNGVLEVIDGQQRLTTLFILLSVLRSSSKIDFSPCNLIFESRVKSTNALKKISTDEHVDENLNPRIIDAQKIIEERLKRLDSKKFVEFLLKKVIILRVEVPEDTDLNHYFEIMNSRGEQLEKHEILKSRLLEKLKNKRESTVIFNQIWETCANMEEYVQYGFSMIQREKIFGSKWNEFKIENFDAIEIENPKEEEEKEDLFEEATIENLIHSKSQKVKKGNKERNDIPERFNSVINFPNFLLQVLKLQINKDIPLDDKRLLETFLEYIKSEDEVKLFAYNLLKLRFLFDNYVIKRDFSKEQEGEWSLLQLIKNDSRANNTAYYKNRFEDNEKNEHLIMLLSMFHVSSSTLIYKHWLTASLKYLMEASKPIAENDYISYLKRLAEVYMCDRFLNDKMRSYHDIIYAEKLKIQNSCLKWKKLNLGTGVENFVFNYLDYLLWLKESSRYKDFKFTFRTSVEHYYPQNPMESIPSLEEDVLNSFGNLCLIHSSENSRLSNFTPKAKKDFYAKQINSSLKQRIMMGYDSWEKKDIEKHDKEMRSILEDSFKIDIEC